MNIENSEFAAGADGSAKQPLLVSGAPVFERRNSFEFRFLLATFTGLVILPTLIALIYFSFIASDRYVSEAGFEVRNASSGAQADSLGFLAGFTASTGSTNSDSHIVLNYLTSRAVVEKLDQDIQLRKYYSDRRFDRWSRLADDAPAEDVVKYWEKHINASYEATSGIISFKVQAFDPQMAKLIAQKLLIYSRDLVNKISENARYEAVREAEAEVGKSKRQLQSRLNALRSLRERFGIIDPKVEAELQAKVVGDLEKQLIETIARKAVLGQVVDADSPASLLLNRQETALRSEIEAIRLRGTSSKGLSSVISSYEALQIDKAAAEQTYSSALAVLEKAKLEAVRQQRYFAIFAYPSMPELALYPRRILNVVLTFVVSFSIWGILILIGYSVREHRS